MTVVELSTTEFDVLWELEGLPRRPVILDVPSPGRTHSERARLVEMTLRSLTNYGLVERGRTGHRTVPDLADLLGVIANPQRAIDVRMWTDRHVRALAGAQGDAGVLAVLDRDRVVMRTARGTALPQAATSIIGERTAGAGHSVSVPHDVLVAADRATGGDPRRLATELVVRGVQRDDARTLAGMCAGMTAFDAAPRSRRTPTTSADHDASPPLDWLRGQFGAETVDHTGRRVRAGRVVAFHDTGHGRYLHTTRFGADGRRWSTITPADLRLITACVAELISETTAASR